MMGQKNVVTIGEMISLRNCENKFFLSKLAKSEDTQKFQFLRNCLDGVKRCLLEGVPQDEMIDNMEVMFTAYDKEWFSFAAQYEQSKDRDYQNILRLARHLYAMEAEVVALDQAYVIPMPHLKYGETAIDGISGIADMVIRTKSGFEAIRFQFGSPGYSYAARSEIKKPVNAMELISMDLGLRGRYPGIKVSLYYLKHKDDDGSTFLAFESKKGKNIIQQDFSGMGKEELARHSYHASVLNGGASCDDCGHAAMCRFPRNVRVINEEPVPSGRAAAPHVQFTAPQEEVIQHKEGPMNCIAAPGAGKTSCLVQRMMYLMDQGVSPNHILFVTFTRKAAEEIKDRVARALGVREEVCLPNIYTFNGLGFEILKSNPGILGSRVKLASTLDRLVIIRDLLRDEATPRIKGVSYQGIFLEYGLIRTLDKWFVKIEEKGEEQFLSEFKKVDADGVVKLYRLFRQEWEREGYITYDMQISLCNEMFARYPALAQVYSRVFRYIMVDEFQDVSEENATFIYSIAKHHNNILVVGDDDQSIYGFRGGSNKYMLEFAETFAGAKTVVMNDNFRSNAPILDASSALISRNTVRFDKHIVAHRDNPHMPILFKNFTMEKLAPLVKSILSKGYHLGDIAIIGRFNKELVKISEYLQPLYPCNSPKDYLVNDRVFQQIYDVLNLYHTDMLDDVSLYHFLIWEGVEAGHILKWNRKVSLFENIMQVKGAGNEAALPIPEGQVRVMQRIAEYVRHVKYAEGIPPLLAALMSSMFSLESHPVMEIIISMCEDRGITSVRSLYELMGNMILFADDTRVGYPVDRDCINILTAHDSKGKEFPVVLINGSEDFSDTEEERRLLYVAMTRAKNTLFVAEGEYSKAMLLPECVEYMKVI